MSWAIVHELEGNRKLAKESTQNAENSHPNKVYDFLFNYLYFYLSEGEYKKAIETLNQMAEKATNTFIHPVINFLYYQFEKTKDLSLLFNVGVVIFIWGDKKLGEKELKAFINLIKNDPAYKILLEYAESLINNLPTHKVQVADKIIQE
ncbi:MAG: hypothetical protein AAB653_00010 [Patescibacteria group bacterium]